MDKLSQMMETDIDELITELIGTAPPKTSEDPEMGVQESYQLPVRHTKGGAEIDEENKPWIVGTFLPGQYISSTHPHGHEGMDLKAPKGTPIYPIASGVVKKTGVYPKGGKYVVTLHENGNVRAYYAHLDKILVQKGEEVDQNTVLGEMGDTGNAKGRGAHLHYEVSIDGRKINPQSITGKRVGSLAKKAEFVKNLIAKLDEKYNSARLELFKKIAAVDDLTKYKIYKSFKRKEEEEYNGNPLGDAIREFINVKDYSNVAEEIAPYLIEKELNSKSPNPHFLVDVFVWLDHADQLKYIDLIPDNAIFTFAESIPYSYENYSDVLWKFYDRAAEYFSEKGSLGWTNSMLNARDLIEEKYGHEGMHPDKPVNPRDPMGYQVPLEKGEGVSVPSFYKMLKAPKQQALQITEDNPEGRLVEITEEGKLEPAPAEVIPLFEQDPKKAKRMKEFKKIAEEIDLDFNLNETEKKIFNLLRQVIKDKAPDTELRVAGGWVRDKLLGKESHDIDISVDNMSGLGFARLTKEWMQEHGMPTPKNVAVVEANPDAKKSLETAILPIYGVPIDFVQLRTDVYDYRSRKPRVVTGVTPEEDAKRRDLTINSIFYNINNDKIEDFVGGIEDLKKGIARTPLDPYNTFMEDPLRILRAVRFAAKYGLQIDPELIEASNHPDVQEAFRDKISKERVWTELVGQQEKEGWKKGLMIGPNFDRAARLMGEMGLRDLLFKPHEDLLERVKGKSEYWEKEVHPWTMDQDNPYHNLNVWEHTLKALNYMKKIHDSNLDSGVERKVEDQIVRNLAMLLHDVGKCDACAQQLHEKGYTTYHGHEKSSAVMADQMLRELKAPNNIRERVVNLVKHHMRLHHLPSGSKGAGLRRVLRDVGAEDWPLLIEMSQSDSMGKTKSELDPKYEQFAQYIDKFLEETAGQSEVQPPLNGHEIMQILGLERGGPAVGKAVKALKDAMLENPELSREEAVALIEKMK